LLRNANLEAADAIDFHFDTIPVREWSLAILARSASQHITRMQRHNGSHELHLLANGVTGPTNGKILGGTAVLP
jgi:hypothetical protein